MTPDLEIEVYVMLYGKDLQIICMKQMEEDKDCKQDVVLSNLDILMMLFRRNIYLIVATKQKREKGSVKVKSIAINGSAILTSMITNDSV